MASGLGQPSASAVADAMAMRPIVHTIKTTGGGGTPSNVHRLRIGPVLLVLASQNGDQAATDKVLSQVREVTTPGSEPGGAGGLTAQDELGSYGLLALVRNDPQLWAQVDTATRERADLVMTAGLVGSAFTTSDANPYVTSRTNQRTIDGNRGVGRDWNPNYREGMLGSVVAASAYFGESESRRILDDFDLDSFLADTRAAGLTNIATIYSTSLTNPSVEAPTGAQIAAAVDDWSAFGIGLDDPMGLILNLADDTYAAVVTCGLNGGSGVQGSTGEVGGMVNGACSAVSQLGRTGMIRELASGDAEGLRSSLFYSYGAVQGSLLNQIVVKATGEWDAARWQSIVGSRQQVGMEDFWDKVEVGYRNFSLGKFQGVLDSTAPGYNFEAYQTAWYDVLGKNA